MAQLVFTFITTLCALYIAVATLKHNAKPAVAVELINPGFRACGTEVTFRFLFVNVGHWYARPTAVDVTAFFNFSPQFALIELLYGSTQSYKDTDFKTGGGGLIYLKAKGLKLTHGEEGEEVHVRTVTPQKPGDYRVCISAYSTNGANVRRDFVIPCELPCASDLPGYAQRSR